VCVFYFIQNWCLVWEKKLKPNRPDWDQNAPITELITWLIQNKINY